MECRELIHTDFTLNICFIPRKYYDCVLLKDIIFSNNYKRTLTKNKCVKINFIHFSLFYYAYNNEITIVSGEFR